MYRYVRNPDPRKKPPYGSRIDPTHPLSQGLVGCWLLNEGGGRTAFSVATNLPGSVSQHETEWEGSGLKLGESYNGIGVTVSYDSRLQITEQIGLALIMRTSSFTQSWAKGITQGHDESYTLQANHAGSNSPSMRIWSGGSGYNAVASTNIADGKQHTLFGTYGGGEVRIFVDGKKEDYTPLSGSISISTSDIGIGRDPTNDNVDYYTGFLYAAYIFDRAPSEDEIAWFHAEPYAHILVPQYWHMVDFGAGVGEVPMAVKMSYYLRQMGA